MKLNKEVIMMNEEFNKAMDVLDSELKKKFQEEML
jgi:hypothetical protein